MNSTKNGKRNLIFALLLLSIFIFAPSCNNGTGPDKYANLVSYLPLEVGNSWTYNYNYITGIFWFEQTKTNGTETWEVTSISSDNRNLTIKSTFNGIKIHDFDGFIDSTIYVDQVNYLELKLVDGPSSEEPSHSLIQDECIDCGDAYNPLRSLFWQPIVNNFKRLEIAFIAKEASLLVKSTGIIRDPNDYFTTYSLDYTIEKNLGIKKLEFQWEDYESSSGTITWELVETDF